jgi:hypothetical protein
VLEYSLKEKHVTLPLLVKNAERQLINCSLHVTDTPDAKACEEILRGLTHIFKTQFGYQGELNGKSEIN